MKLSIHETSYLEALLLASLTWLSMVNLQMNLVRDLQLGTTLDALTAILSMLITIQLGIFIGKVTKDCADYQSYCLWSIEQDPCADILPESEFLLHYNAIQQEKSSQGDK